MCFQRAADLQCAFHRLLWTLIEDQRHSIAGWNLDQSTRCFRIPKFLCAANNLIERIERPALLVDQKFRVANDVHEQDMSDHQLNSLFNLSGHPVKLPAS